MTRMKFHRCSPPIRILLFSDSGLFSVQPFWLRRPVVLRQNEPTNRILVASADFLLDHLPQTLNSIRNRSYCCYCKTRRQIMITQSFSCYI